MENTAIINTLDPELLAPIISRRDAIAKGASASSKVVAALALGSVPIALGALAKDVYGQTPADVLDVLQFALTLEYLEAEFYTRGVAATGLIPGAAVAVFTQIRDHENTHVNTLRTVIGGREQHRSRSLHSTSPPRARFRASTSERRSTRRSRRSHRPLRIRACVRTRDRPDA